MKEFHGAAALTLDRFVGRLSVVALSFVVFAATDGVAEESAPTLRVFPQEIQIAGPVRNHRLLAQWSVGEQVRSQVRNDATWSTSNADVAVVNEGGRVEAVGDGLAEIRVTAAGQTAVCKVHVENSEAAADNAIAWTFRNHVLPVLSKAGCNSGACHGALAGKGGFRLSLRGYDPDSDHYNITRQDRGRRIELSDPGRSLVLAKPSGALPHKGGLRFDVDSTEYQIVSQWIARGAASPTEDDALLERLELLPSSAILAVGDEEQILVRAHYSDGLVEDVTDRVKWTSADQSVARVDDNGLVSVIGPGEGAVTAWFSSKIVIGRVTVPYDAPADATKFDEARNFIDENVDAKLKQLQLSPSPRCSDAEFVRRVYVDTVGTLPTPTEVRNFLTSMEENKRDVLIDALLARPEFVDYWTYRWSDLLMLNGTLLRPNGIKSYYHWIRGHVEKNTRWDVFVREILTATGSSTENGATNFYALHQDPENMTENACQAFLGLSVACAKCHNHPLEKWTNDQYYGMANLFARVRAKGWGGDPRSGDGLRTLYVATTGDLVQPRTGRPQPPTPLDGTSLSFDDPSDRREHLAAWMTSAENPYFARAITNRVWANFFGVGLVEPVDDMRVSNPASNEALLSAAAAFLVEKEFDLKQLMKAILQSNAYQRSSQPNEGNVGESRFYSRYYPRRLMAEVLLDGFSQVTSVPTDFKRIAFPGADSQPTDFYPEGTRAIQLYDSAVESYFLQTFGRNQRRITCECERSDEPSMVQVLHISNGNTLNAKLQKKGNRIDRLSQLQSLGMSDDSLLDEVFLMCLSRFPKPEERAKLRGVLTEDSQIPRRIILEDLFWALLSSREFLFNH